MKGKRSNTTVAFDALLCSEKALRMLDGCVARATMPRSGEL